MIQTRLVDIRRKFYSTVETEEKELHFRVLYTRENPSMSTALQYLEKKFKAIIDKNGHPKIVRDKR